MRKLIFIICFLFCISVSFAQSGFINNHPYSNPVTIENPLGAFHPQRGFILPFLDTLNNPASVYNGALVQNPMDSKPYYSDGVRWIPFNTGAPPTQINFTYLAGKYLTDFNTFGTLNTDSVLEAGNLYFTNTRSRLAISSLSPISYNNSTGVLSADTAILATRYDLDSAIGVIPPKWNILGNSGTNASTNFIGTNDNVSLVFKVKGIRFGFLDAAAETTGGNIAFGDSALISATGVGNTAFGNYALLRNTTATFNTAVGYAALAANTTSSFNTAIGYSALNISTGIRNTAVGSEAGRNIVTGVSNTLIGDVAWRTNDGSYNTIIGHRAGYNGSGNDNVMIGDSAGYNSPAGNSRLIIANSATNIPLIFGYFRNPFFGINVPDNTSDTSSLAFEVRSTNKGVLFPRMSTTAMRNMALPLPGTLIYNLDSAAYCVNIRTTPDTVWARLAVATSGAPAAGTVTNVATGYGLSGGPITNSGTLLLDSATVFRQVPVFGGVDDSAFATRYFNNRSFRFTIDSSLEYTINAKQSSIAGQYTSLVLNTSTFNIAKFSGINQILFRNIGDTTLNTHVAGLTPSYIDVNIKPQYVQILSSGSTANPVLFALKAPTATFNKSKAAFFDTDSLKYGNLVVVDSLRRKVASDSVFWYNGATKVFAYKDSIGNAGGIDSIRRKSTTDTIRQWTAGVPTFAFRDNGLVDSIKNISTSVQRVYYSDGTTSDNLFELDSAITTRLVSSNVQITNSVGGTTENTVYTATIPANSIGANGSFEIHALWSYPNNANNKTLRCRFNGTAVINRILTTTVADRWIGYISNRNSLTSQIAGGAGGGQAVGTGSSGTALSTFSFDTGAAITVTLTIQNASSGDASTTALEAFEIIANP